MRGEEDAVVPGGTRVTLPVRYSDRSLAALSAVWQRNAMIRFVRSDRSSDDRARWMAYDESAPGGWRRLGAYDSDALERLRLTGAVREASGDRVMVTMLGEHLGPLWLRYAAATGRQDRVLELVRAIVGESVTRPV